MHNGRSAKEHHLRLLLDDALLECSNGSALTLQWHANMLLGTKSHSFELARILHGVSI